MHRPAADGSLCENSCRPAGQPTMHLASPIHFWGYLIGMGILLDVFSSLWVIGLTLATTWMLPFGVSSSGSCKDMAKRVMQWAHEASAKTAAWCKYIWIFGFFGKSA